VLDPHLGTVGGNVVRTALTALPEGEVFGEADLRPRRPAEKHMEGGAQPLAADVPQGELETAKHPERLVVQKIREGAVLGNGRREAAVEIERVEPDELLGHVALEVVGIVECRHFAESHDPLVCVDFDDALRVPVTPSGNPLVRRLETDIHAVNEDFGNSHVAPPAGRAYHNICMTVGR
jgi:hypothetical protein